MRLPTNVGKATALAAAARKTWRRLNRVLVMAKVLSDRSGIS
jgi:hypothetical protein